MDHYNNVTAGTSFDKMYQNNEKITAFVYAASDSANQIPLVVWISVCLYQKAAFEHEMGRFSWWLHWFSLGMLKLAFSDDQGSYPDDLSIVGIERKIQNLMGWEVSIYGLY